MGSLLPNKKKINNIGASDIKIENDVTVDVGEKKYTAKDRRPVQVDPPVLKTIRDLSYAKDIPMYDIVKLGMNALIDTLSEEERLMYNKRINK